MKQMAKSWPNFHLPTLEQSRWIYTAVVVAVVLAGLIAVGWYAGTGEFGSWSLFEE